MQLRRAVAATLTATLCTTIVSSHCAPPTDAIVDRELPLEHLERIVGEPTATADDWSDYAVALHTRAVRGDVFALTTALAAADHAIDLREDLPEALFARAVILDDMAFYTAATKARKAYLRVDSRSRRAVELRERQERVRAQREPPSKPVFLSDLRNAAASDDILFINDAVVRSPESMRRLAYTALWQWGEFAVTHDNATATHFLKVARILGTSFEKQFGDSFFIEAVRAIDSAHDRQPLVKAHAAYGSFRAARTEKLRGLERVFAANRSPMAFLVRDQDRVPERYRLLAADLEWQRGNAAARNGLADAAMTSFRRAHAAYQALREENRAATALSEMAVVLNAMGQTEEGWRLRSVSIEVFARLENQPQLSQSVYLAALDALRDDRFDLAHSLLNVVVDTADPLTPIYYQALLWRGAAASKAGLARTASTELSLVQSIARAEERDDLMADCLRVAALVHGNNAEYVRLWLDDAFEIDTARTSELFNHSIRNYFLRQPFNTFHALASGEDARGEIDLAMALLDLYRRESRSPVAMDPFGEWERSIPSDSVLISYGIFRIRLAIYVTDAHSTSRVSVWIPQSQLERLVKSFDGALRKRNDRAIRIAGNALFRVLIAPVARSVAGARSIIIVPDRSMRRIPFAALMQSNGRYLIEDHSIVVSPNINSYVVASRANWAMSRALLAVGDPVLDERFKSLPRLDGAQTEAKTVSAMYPSHALLVGRDATKRRVVGALAYCDSAHFAVHAAVALNDVAPPHLILTESADDDGRLGSAEIAGLDLDHVRTVMLAGCRTAVATSRRPQTRSLVDAFLTAGVGSVVGSLWEIEDEPTLQMSVAFHRALRNGETPAAALRTAQLSMIDSTKPHRSPRDWASLQLYGSGD